MLRSIIVLGILASSGANASSEQHRFDVGYSYADISKDTSPQTQELNDVVTSHYSLSYQYQLNKYLGLGVGYINGDSSRADGLLIDIFTDSKVDYSAVLLSAQLSYPFAERHAGYVAIHATQYDFDVFDDGKINVSDDGTDLGFAFGWQYNFDNGLGIRAGYEVVNLGEHIDIKGFTTGINYRF